jgi:PleD family two-component response regulator
MPNQTVDRARTILLIDPDYAVSATLDPYFKQQGFEIALAKTGSEGLNQALAHLPSMVLLTTRLPDGDGAEVFKQLRKHSRTAHIPVMFLAEHQDAKLQNELLSAGADDFVLKPFDVDILGLRVRNAIKRQEREGLQHSLTGMATGRLIEDRLADLQQESDWYKMDFGIDNFDSFRDRYGFMTGEEVIVFTSHLINEVVQAAGAPEDFIGHRDNTDFVIITRQNNGPKLRALLEKRFNDEVLSFYTFMERDQGGVEVADGSGGVVKKPLMAAKINVEEGKTTQQAG